MMLPIQAYHKHRTHVTPTLENKGPDWIHRVGSLAALGLLLPVIVAGCLWGGAVLSADRGGARGADSDPKVQVIVNRSVDVPSLSQYKLRTLFGMRLSSWPNGMPVHVFVLPDKHPLHRRFAKQLLEVFPHQLRRAWNNLIYSGLGQAPTVVATEQEMRDRVAATPGAVGYVNSSTIGYATTGGEHVQTRVLPIR